VVMNGDSPHRSARWSGPRWRGRGEPFDGKAEEQELQVRAKLYSKPPLTERTVEVLGPVVRLVDRSAA